MHSSRRSRTVVAVAALLAGGFGISPSAAAAPKPAAAPTAAAPTAAAPNSAASAAAAADVETADDRLVAVADQVPEFGGLHPDAASGTIRIYLTRPSADTLARARAALAEHYPTVFTAEQRVEAEQGTYGMRALYDWYQQLSPQALAQRDVVLTDIDEAANRLTVGVATDAAAATVRGLVARLAIPAGAVQIERTAPEVPLSLQTGQSTMRGGIQIGNDGGGICTLGFVAERAGGRGLVTNSHCTNIQGGTEGTRLWQSKKPNPCGLLCFAIATETADPQYTALAPGILCPVGRLCRFSDSAFGKFGVPEFGTPGRIARPAGFNLGAAWNDTSTFRIIIDWMDPEIFTFIPASHPANKVGRTSGWTQGQIFSTCVSVNQADTNKTMLCQYRSLATAQPGDSGSPVFVRNPGTNDVMLIGIQWGTTSFSSMELVEAELGALNPCEPATGC